MKRSIVIAVAACCVILTPWVSYSEGLSEYLILNDIGIYKISKLHEAFIGEPPIGGPRTEDGAGVLRATHFSLDHTDKTYEVFYWNEGDNVATPTVQVTQHAGGESDRWLLHEIEEKYRGDEDETRPLGSVSEYSVMFDINGQNVLFNSMGGGDYTWISGSKVVNISYSSIGRRVPLPKEVVNAYLAKFPSDITITDEEFKSSDHTKVWIKDEMERRMWLCDKWLAAYAAQKVEAKDFLYEMQNSLDVFLQFAEKYYGKDVKDDRALLGQYQYVTKNVDDMKKKHAELKAWWTNHKDDSSVMKMFRKLIP